jgi:hypothetical protein
LEFGAAVCPCIGAILLEGARGTGANNVALGSIELNDSWIDYLHIVDRRRWRHSQVRWAEHATAGGRCSVRLGHRYAGDRFAREVHQRTEAGVDRQEEAEKLLAEKGLRVVFSGAVDKTQTHRPLVNIYQASGEEIGKTLLREGFARPWSAVVAQHSGAI